MRRERIAANTAWLRTTTAARGVLRYLQSPMCGRTALTADPEDLRDALGLTETPHLTPHYNVPPSRPVAVLREPTGSPERRLELLRWGLVPAWADDVKIAHKLALARVETVATAKVFRDAVRNRRCLVIVNGFFEWRREGKRPSQPFFVRRADDAPFALAGVWERWISRDGEVIESCAIITQPSRPPVETIHDRMPLVLERDAWDRWLDPASMDSHALAALLEPRTPPLEAYAVSPRVNDPSHDDRECLEPARVEQLTLIG
jgi:putative SOS response-associated peptidase YedK